mmetsp:Transcript_42570/g.137440  ORF Transcript_42570/g.137440 Transcript_42570/m.137440 type:complete len:214 (-) Transcript_42570:35-676(-)
MAGEAPRCERAAAALCACSRARQPVRVLRLPARERARPARARSGLQGVVSREPAPHPPPQPRPAAAVRPPPHTCGARRRGRAGGDCRRQRPRSRAGRVRGGAALAPAPRQPRGLVRAGGAGRASAFAHSRLSAPRCFPARVGDRVGHTLVFTCFRRLFISDVRRLRIRPQALAPRRRHARINPPTSTRAPERPPRHLAGRGGQGTAPHSTDTR